MQPISGLAQGSGIIADPLAKDVCISSTGTAQYLAVSFEFDIDRGVR